MPKMHGHFLMEQSIGSHGGQVRRQDTSIGLADTLPVGTQLIVTLACDTVLGGEIKVHVLTRAGNTVDTVEVGGCGRAVLDGGIGLLVCGVLGLPLFLGGVAIGQAGCCVHVGLVWWGIGLAFVSVHHES